MPSKGANSLLLILVALLLIVGGTYYFKSSQSRQATISGSFNLNGYVPANSTISVLAKLSTDKTFHTIVNNVPATDDAGWSWSGAESGKTYDVQAVLIVNGQKSGLSQVQVIEAPATGEVLTINSVANPPAPQTTSISGTIDLNGAVTQQSSISLAVRKPGEASFNTVNPSIAAQDGASWSWDAALAGQQYEVKATLYVDGAYSGESKSLVVTAPASNEVLRINSQYTPPPTPAAISGSLNINGPIPANSTVVLYKQGPGDKAPVAVLSKLEAANGTTWNWTNAISGYTYTIKASVMQNGTSVGNSQVLTVTAPAANEVLNITINVSGNPTNQPSNSPTVACISQSGNTWNATLNLPAVSGANTYWIRIGSQSGSNNFLDTRIAANGTSNTSYALNNINNGTTYFVQYAASTCTNCSNSGAFSSFSNILQFVCQPQQPTPTPTPYPVQPTYTPYPTYTPAPTAVPTATPTVTPSPLPTATPEPTDTPVPVTP